MNPSKLLTYLFVGLSLAAAVPSQTKAESFKPDDQVIFDLSAEGWVTTQSALVTLQVESAVNSSNSGTMRSSMAQAVENVVKAEWKLTAFNRMQDQTGLERWSATYEARIPENQLNNLSEKAKSNSKAGMQITVANIDFTPTLEEKQAVMSKLRQQIYKQANEQLAALVSVIPEKSYRISVINFTNEPVTNGYGGGRMMKHAQFRSAEADMVASAPKMMESPAERSVKLTTRARVILASSAATTPTTTKP